MEHYDIAVMINDICKNDITSTNLRRGLKSASLDMPRNFYEFICDGIDEGLLELLIENKYGFSPVDNAFLKSKMVEYLVNKQQFTIDNSFDIVKILSHLSEIHYLNIINKDESIAEVHQEAVSEQDDRIFKDSHESESVGERRRGQLDGQLGYYLFNQL